MSDTKIFSAREMSAIKISDQMDIVRANVYRARQSNHRLLMHLRIARKKNVQMSELTTEIVAAYIRGERDAFMFAAKSSKAWAEKLKSFAAHSPKGADTQPKATPTTENEDE